MEITQITGRELTGLVESLILAYFSDNLYSLRIAQGDATRLKYKINEGMWSPSIGTRNDTVSNVLTITVSEAMMQAAFDRIQMERDLNERDREEVERWEAEQAERDRMHYEMLSAYDMDY